MSLRAMMLVGILVSSYSVSVANTVVADERSNPLAKVGNQPITVADVNLLLGRGDQKSLEGLSPVAIQTTIELIAKQRQALQTMRKLGIAAGADSVNRFLEQSLDTTQTGKTAIEAEQAIAEATRRFGVTETSYLDTIDFRLSWKRYLATYLNEKNMRKHFLNQPKRFDGTRFETAVISVAVPAGKNRRREEATKELEALASQVDADGLAAILAQSKERQWEVRDLDWVRGMGSVDPRLVDEMVRLEIGKLSAPIQTATGVHRIVVMAIEDGKLEFSDVQPEVRAHMLIFLLDYLARQSAEQLPLTQVE